MVPSHAANMQSCIFKRPTAHGMRPTSERTTPRGQLLAAWSVAHQAYCRVSLRRALQLSRVRCPPGSGAGRGLFRFDLAKNPGRDEHTRECTHTIIPAREKEWDRPPARTVPPGAPPVQLGHSAGSTAFPFTMQVPNCMEGGRQPPSPARLHGSACERQSVHWYCPRPSR